MLMGPLTEVGTFTLVSGVRSTSGRPNRLKSLVSKEITTGVLCHIFAKARTNCGAATLVPENEMPDPECVPLVRTPRCPAESSHTAAHERRPYGIARRITRRFHVYPSIPAGDKRLGAGRNGAKRTLAPDEGLGWVAFHCRFAVALAEETRAVVFRVVAVFKIRLTPAPWVTERRVVALDPGINVRQGPIAGDAHSPGTSRRTHGLAQHVRRL